MQLGNMNGWLGRRQRVYIKKRAFGDPRLNDNGKDMKMTV